MKPILFLDIDGVLNSEMWYRKRKLGCVWCEADEIDPEALFLLRAVVVMSNCDIVISSSWRIGRTIEELQKLFPNLPIIDKTPELTTGKTRGEEVDLYLSKNAHIRRYAIVDDNSDFYDHHPRVQTSWKLGLTPMHAEELVRLLTLPVPHE